MGPYSDKASVVFPIMPVVNNFGSTLSGHHISQLRMAETEKFAHVTYFFNSQIEKPSPQEDRIMIDSKKAASFAEIPEMSAREITDRLTQEMSSQKYPMIIVNFANADLVGHSGNFNATIKAIEVLDECLGRIEKLCK